MTLVTTFAVGKLRCHTLEAGCQRLDGGAMFGVVPKPLWERRIAADERNRIQLALRCLLVEHIAGPVLIDTGVGNKETAKFIDIYGVENDGQDGPTQLEDALRRVGFRPEDVVYVVNTHLHFDHAGGNTWVERGAEGREPRLSFPNATYVVQSGELKFGRHLNERTAASYLAHNFEPVAEAGKWETVTGEVELLPGIRLLPTPGHVPHHQSVLISDADETACFLGDLVPTAAHVPLPWIMGYDLEPLVTLESKRQLLGRAATEGWTMIFEHDPEVALGRISRDQKSYFCEPV
ncbi:MAG: MBL fold metallo-hydrolase [Gemmatimonadota bacterium]|nr:MAG: MBL fold metallo-hydrolase [Gemmatimonadota bacterium]